MSGLRAWRCAGMSARTSGFKRVHEHALHWYRRTIPWSEIHHETPTTQDAVRKAVRRRGRPPHMGEIGSNSYESHDGGPRLMRSVIFARSLHGIAVNETQKPLAARPLHSVSLRRRSTSGRAHELPWLR